MLLELIRGMRNMLHVLVGDMSTDSSYHVCDDCHPAEIWRARLQLLGPRGPERAWQPRFVPVNATGGPVQPALLRAAERAVDAGGSVMLTVRKPYT